MTTRNMSIQLLSSLQTRGIFNFIPSSQYAMISHCVFNFHFPDDYWLWPCLFTTFIFFSRVSIHIFSPLYLCDYLIIESKVIFCIQVFIKCVFSKCLLSICDLSFHFFISVFWTEKEISNLMNFSWSIFFFSFCIMSKKYLPNSRSQQFSAFF